MRKVMVISYKQNPEYPRNWVKYEKGEAVFHEFGVGCEDSESNYGNFSTAIVEWPDGQVENVKVENIRFLDWIAA